MRRRMPITIIMYHSIGDRVDRYTVTPASFERQIRWLLLRYPVISLDEACRLLQTGRRSSRRRVVITFDDAFLDFYETAFPILRRLDVPSTVFVPSGHVGGQSEWDAGVPECAPKPLMDWAQIRELRETKLVDFGSHTVDHVAMSHLSREQQLDQAVRSRRTIEQHLDAPVRAFAYPYGLLDHFSAETSRVLIEAGYRVAVTSLWGTSNSGADLLRLRRIFFDDEDPERTIRRKVEGWHDWRGLKSRVGFLARRSKVGRRLYGLGTAR